jgi:hypothetical protein
MLRGQHGAALTPLGGLVGSGSCPDDIIVIFTPFFPALGYTFGAPAAGTREFAGNPVAGVVRGPAGGRVRVCARVRGSLPKPGADVR